jgi:N-acetylneuraminic acid mutarotase
LFFDENILEILELYVALIKENAMKSTRRMTNTIFAMLLGLLVIAAGNQAFAQGGTWETKAPMPTVRWNAAGGVINGKLYVAGGWSGVSLATLEVYDPATNTWATKAPMTTARDGAAGGVINGKLYVVGGDIAQNQKLATLEVYDPAADTWTAKASMRTPRSGPGAAVIDGKLYVAGGCQGWCAPVTNVLEVYDPATDTWATKAPLPTARGGTDVEVVNGLFYVMGGCCGSVGSDTILMAKTIEAYNPTTNTWTTKTQHVIGGGDTAGSINGKIYVAKSAATEVYDPATDTWAFLSPMSIARQYAAGGVINGKLYVAGGYYGTVGSATLEAFTPFMSVSADYFPLSVGNTWIYYPSFGANGNRVDTVIGEETINGIHTYIWNRQEAPNDNYNEKRWIAKDNSGVKVYKFWSNEGPDPAVIINPPWITSKSKPNVGDTFIGEFEPSSGILYTVTSTIESVSETVTVPAGSFANCVRIKVLNEMTVNSNKTAVNWYREWYAPNIGRVIYAKYNDNWGSATTTQQLIGFSVTRGLPGDANSDAKLGLDDAIYILQILSGIRP